MICFGHNMADKFYRSVFNYGFNRYLCRYRKFAIETDKGYKSILMHKLKNFILVMSGIVW
jgi:hypothetical protein